MTVSYKRDLLVVDAQGPSWLPLVKSRLEGRFQAIANLVAGRKTADGEEIGFKLIKQGSAALSLKVRVRDKSAYLKLFDMEQPEIAYQREKAAMCALRESGLVPRILAFTDGPRFILAEWALDDVGEVFRLEKDPMRFAARLGAWLAQLDNACPTEPVNGHWYGYLGGLGEQLNIDRVAAAQDMLIEIPLRGRKMPVDDVALQNFLVNAERYLLGRSLERDHVRPRGWEFILGNIGLVEWFPEQAEEVLRSYAEGFQDAHQGDLSVEEMNLLSRILFHARSSLDEGQGVVRWQ